MARIVTLQDDFSGGCKRDAPRDALPGLRALYWAEDMLPVVAYQGQSARLRQRGGYSYFSADISTTVATTQYIIGGIIAPYAAGVCGVLIDEDGRAIKLTMSDGSLTDVAAANTVSANPSFHRDMVIVPGSTVKKITNAAGTLTVASLAGSPPASTYAATWNDRTLLARGTSTNLNRLWFGGLGDPESWNTTNGYWDFSFDITGIAPLKRAILVFHESYVSRLVGSTPPPGGDLFSDDPLWTVGCTDARSIAYWGDRVLFASPEGIYITDGSGVDDVTVKCGMQSWWQETLASYSSSTWTIAAGVHRDFYTFTVMDGSTFKAGAFIDLRRMAWWPVTNIQGRSYFVGQSAADELYAGLRNTDRVAKLSPVLMPSSTVKNDGDGTAVTGLVETGYYGQGSEKSWSRLVVKHYLRDYASDNPTVAVSYASTPEATAYTSTGVTLAENTAEADAWVDPLGFSGRGAAFKLDKSNAGDWQLNAIRADVAVRSDT